MKALQTISHKFSGMRNLAILAINRFSLWRVYANPVNLDLSKPYVILSYPHTSNWDTFIGLISLTAVGIKPAIVVKDSWNVPFLGGLLKKAGVIFIDREKADMEAMKKDLLSSGRSVVLAIEGTREKVKKVKKGFYFFAKELGLDIVPSVVNYRDREVRLLKPIRINNKAGGTKRLSTVIKEIRAAYEPYAGTAKRPENESPIR